MKTTLMLKSIFIFCILNSAFTNFSNAQLIYTDIIPDDTLQYNTNYQLDLNNDGTMDFEFSYSLIGYGICEIYRPFPHYVHSYARVTAINSGFQVATHLGSPAALNLDDTIQGWMTPDLSLLLHGYYNCNPYTMEFDGNWNSSSDHYLGVKFYKNGDWYYGWIRMNIMGGSGQQFVPIVFTIKDYAYESTPNQRIFAEETTTGVNEIQAGSTFSVFPNPFSHHTFINFQLSKKERISLKIFDLNGRLIKTFADNTLEEGEHQMEWSADEETAGIYLLQIQSEKFSKMVKLVVTK
jgi:hypothetical protein